MQLRLSKKGMSLVRAILLGIADCGQGRFFCSAARLESSITRRVHQRSSSDRNRNRNTVLNGAPSLYTVVAFYCAIRRQPRVPRPASWRDTSTALGYGSSLWTLFLAPKMVPALQQGVPSRSLFRLPQYGREGTLTFYPSNNEFAVSQPQPQPHCHIHSQ